MRAIAECEPENTLLLDQAFAERSDEIGMHERWNAAPQRLDRQLQRFEKRQIQTQLRRRFARRVLAQRIKQCAHAQRQLERPHPFHTDEPDAA